LGIVIGLLAFGFACGQPRRSDCAAGLGTFFTGLAMAAILFAPASLIFLVTGDAGLRIASGSYAAELYLVKSQVTDRETALRSLLPIAHHRRRGLVLQPLIAVIADAEGRAVTTPNALGILVWRKVWA